MRGKWKDGKKGGAKEKPPIETTEAGNVSESKSRRQKIYRKPKKQVLPPKRSDKVADRIQDALDSSIGSAVPRERGKAVSEFDRDKMAQEANHPIYYKRIPGVLDALTTVYDNYIAGSSVRRFFEPGELTWETGDVAAVPGVMTIHVVPCCGASDGSRDAIGQTMNAIFAMIRHYTTGATNYDAEDLFMYILAMANAYAFHAELVRVYGCLTFYNALNRYTARGIVRSLGFDSEDLQAHQADFLALINLYAAELSQFCVPNVWSVLDKWYNAFQNLYTDNESNRAQYYAFVPAGYYLLDTSASRLRWNNNSPVTPLTLDAIRARIRAYLDPIRRSEDYSTMSGDILRCYGLGNLVSAPIINDKYKTVPAHNVEVLSMIENMRPLDVSLPDTATGELPPIVSLDITTSDNAVHFNPAWTGPSPTLPVNMAFLNFRHDKPTEDEILEATRLRPVVEYSTFQTTTPFGYTAKLISCDTLLPIHARVWYLSGYYTPEDLQSSIVRFSNNSSLAAMSDLLVARIAQFNWAPFVIGAEYNRQTKKIKDEFLLGEVDNLVPWSTINQMNLDAVCLKSEFWTPGISNL